jgi:hypothetical protein
VEKMPEIKPAPPVRRETLLEKIIRRTLETVGGSVDRVFGRGKKPDALPSTGDLAERLRKMIDKQAQINQDGRKLAPHLIRLKYAWGQSSDEFLNALKRLKNELLVVAIDHINDNRYVTLAGIKIEAKADILTSGFTMSVGFDEESLQNAEQVEVPVEIYAKLLPSYNPEPAPQMLEIEMTVTATFPGGKERKTVLRFVPEKKANFVVGRMKECDLYLEDPSVSKHHASLVMSKEGILRLADIGSTNGTYLNGTRIAYGKAYEVTADMTVGFGDVTTRLGWEIPRPPEPEIVEEAAPTEEENVQSFETLSGSVKIGVKSVPQEMTDEKVEMPTLAGEKVNYNAQTTPSQEYEAGQMAVTTNLSAPANDSMTTELNSIVGKETSELDSVVGKPTNEFETLANQQVETPPENNASVAAQDFTNKLETNQSDEDAVDKSLVGFDSLLGTSPTDLPKKTSKEEVPPSS